MNIYRFPRASSELVLSGSLVAGEDTSSSLSSGMFRGLPSNEPVHVLVRIYVVKVRLFAVFVYSMLGRIIRTVGYTLLMFYKITHIGSLHHCHAPHRPADGAMFLLVLLPGSDCF